MPILYKKLPYPQSVQLIADHADFAVRITALEQAGGGGPHVHSEGEVTNLTTDLSGKAASTHTHDYEPANANIQSHISSAHAPSNAQKNSDILQTEIEAKLTGAISSHSHAGGSNPVYALLANGTTAMALGTNDVVKVTPTATATFTTTVPAAGKTKTIIILTSGTTSRTITFGSGFKPIGTLATGTVNARVFVIHWVSDGTNLYEAGRTAAMAA